MAKSHLNKVKTPRPPSKPSGTLKIMVTILIVDDEPDIREVMRFALEGSGFRVLEAGHADEARKLMQAEDPDLLLLDWMLPGRSGLELALQLKQNPKTRATPIIMVSARGEEEDRIQMCIRDRNSFLVRLGKLGYNDTHVRLRLEGVTWKITDIVR